MTAEGAIDRPLHSHTIRLSYADTDPAGILYYAAWFPRVENLQAEWFYLQGLRQDTLAERFGFWTVTRAAEAEYLVPVGLFDQIRIELRVADVRGTSFVTEFRMLRTSDEALVGRARLTLVTVSPAGTRTAVPEMLRERLGAWQAFQSGELEAVPLAPDAVPV